MWAPAVRDAEELPQDHPCFGCQARSVAACRVLGCDDLAAMRRLGWTLDLRGGDPLFHQGDAATRVFTLTRGALKLYRLLPDGRRQVTGFMFPGDFLGIAVEDEYAFTVEALVDSQLCGFPRARFSEFVEGRPHLERELYRMVAHELAAAQAQMVLLGRKTAAERLASFLLVMLYQAEKALQQSPRMISLPMSRIDIADYLGLSKETVSRELTSLKRRRIVRLQSLNRVEVIDRRGLVDMAEGHGAA